MMIEGSSGHYQDLRVQKIMSRFSTFNGAYKAGVFDNSGWYRYRGEKRRLINPVNEQDYNYLVNNLQKRLLGTLNFFRPTIYGEWQKKPWNQGDSPGGLEDTWYYMLSIDVDLANDYSVDDEKALKALKKACRFIEKELKNSITDKFLILFSGNGVYFHLHPEFAFVNETKDFPDQKRVSKLQTILDCFNFYLKQLEERMFEKYPEIHGIVKLDAINSRKRVFKLPLSLHKELPYVVFPIGENLEIPLKMVPLADEDFEEAEKLINSFFDNIPTENEKNQLMKVLSTFEREVKPTSKDYNSQSKMEKPPIPIPIALIKKEAVCGAIFSPESWPKGNTRRTSIMVTVLRRCGWDAKNVKKYVSEIVSDWHVSAVDHVIDSWMEFDPPNIDTIYSIGPDYPSLNMGELKDYLPLKPEYSHVIDEIFDIAKERGYEVPRGSDVNSKSQKVSLKYKTDHLSGFGDLAKATSLFGSEYTITFKVLWYSLLSYLIPTSLIKVGQIEVDGRISPLFVLPAGRGKGQIKNVIKQVIGGLKGNYGEPTSLHGEQLVGKTVKDKNNNFNHSLGYLADDYVVIDEAHELLTSSELKYIEARKYIRVALDTYPHNVVHKRTTEYGRSGALEFKPHCPVSLFVQPFRLSSDILVLEGDIRRFTIAYPIISSSNNFEALRKRIFDESDNEIAIHNFIQRLSSLKSIKRFDFSERAKMTVMNLSYDIEKRGKSYSMKIANLNDSIIFTSQNMLVKFAAIQAFQHGRAMVDEIDVILAYLDLFEILEHTYMYIEAKIPGSLDYSEGGNGARKRDHEILQWLKETGVTNKENAIHKQMYIEKIMELMSIKQRQAENVFKEHFEVHQWIEKTKKDKKVYVWLKVIPEECNICNLQSGSSFEYEEYIKSYDLLLKEAYFSLQTANIASHKEVG